jgi:hypothetical protein
VSHSLAFQHACMNGTAGTIWHNRSPCALVPGYLMHESTVLWCCMLAGPLLRSMVHLQTSAIMLNLLFKPLRAIRMVCKVGSHALTESDNVDPEMHRQRTAIQGTCVCTRSKM